jgi:transketolase
MKPAARIEGLRSSMRTMANWLEAIERMAEEAPEREDELHRAIDHMISVSVVSLFERWLPNSAYVDERRKSIASLLRHTVNIVEKRPP